MAPGTLITGNAVRTRPSKQITVKSSVAPEKTGATLFVG